MKLKTNQKEELLLEDAIKDSLPADIEFKKENYMGLFRYKERGIITVIPNKKVYIKTYTGQCEVKSYIEMVVYLLKERPFGNEDYKG